MSVVKKKKIKLPDESIVDINDSRITTANPANGQILTYDTTTSKWVNTNPTPMTTVPMQVTFMDDTTVTYNVYIQPTQ